MENPFLFGDVVKGDYFANREEELKTLILDLSSGQNVLLFSPRRYGKTSLIIRVLDELKARGLVCVYVDFFRAASLQALGKVYADAVTRAAASKIEEAVGFVRSHFPTVIPRITLKGPDSPEFELDFDVPRRDLDKWLDEIYDMPQKIAERKHKRLVVVLDEFQEIANLGEPGIVERSLRAKIQHHDRIAYVFMGSKRHLLDELFADKNKPLYRIAKAVPLGKITKEKLASFLHSRFHSVQMRIDSSNIERILEISGCHPYYTQQLCHEAYNMTVPQKQVTDEQIRKATEQCITAQSYAYTTLWEGLSGKQRELVIALSKLPGGNVYSKEFIDRFNLGSASSVQTAIDALEKKGIIDRENGGFVLSDVFFTQWVQRTIG
jgi:hypothetical protein